MFVSLVSTGAAMESANHAINSMEPAPLAPSGPVPVTAREDSSGRKMGDAKHAVRASIRKA